MSLPKISFENEQALKEFRYPKEQEFVDIECYNKEYEKDFPIEIVPQPYYYMMEFINKNKRIKMYLEGYKLDWFSISEIKDYWDFQNKRDKNFNKENNLKEIKKMGRSLFKYLNGDKVMYRISERRNKANIYGVKYMDNFYFFYNFQFKKVRGKKKIKYNFSHFFNDDIFYRNRKMIRRKIRPEISAEQRRNVFKRDRYTCQYCGWKNGIPGKEERILSIDHIVPSAFGGTNKIDNLKTACIKCNIKKNDKFLPGLLKEWIWLPKDFKKEDCSKVETPNIKS